jgi:HK97 family phage major capsid protein/HK97 family phage prohead protease
MPEAQALEKPVRSETWAAVRAESLKLLARDFDEGKHPREPAGSPEGGRFAGGDSDGGEDKEKPARPELFPELPPPPPPKKDSEIDDFAKDDVQIDRTTRTDKEQSEKFIKQWNDRIGTAPAEFKKQFLGGIPSTMAISYNDDEQTISIIGELLDANGDGIGEYIRSIDIDSNKASSEYFKLSDTKTAAGIGKHMLAANVAFYQHIGLDAVELHANIDVGGYAWAKYGYVPTSRSWGYLSDVIIEKISELSGGFAAGDVDTLRDLANSSDPKAIWAIADSTHGKNLLLGTTWNGVLNLHDPETMERFNAYVGKERAKAKAWSPGILPVGAGQAHGRSTARTDIGGGQGRGRQEREPQGGRAARHREGPHSGAVGQEEITRDWDEEQHPREPSGSSGGGQFTSGGGGSSSSDAKATVGKFVKEHISDVVHSVGQKLKENQKELLAAAVVGGLYHVAGVDFPEDVAERIRDQVVHFADNANVSIAVARGYMQQVANKLVELRGHKAKADMDDPVLCALLGLKKLLDDDELFKDKPGTETTNKASKRDAVNDAPAVPRHAMPRRDTPSTEWPCSALPSNGQAVGKASIASAAQAKQSPRRNREDKVMPISPGKEESQEQWMARCTPDMMGEAGGTRRPQEQAVAACMQMWRDAHRGQKQETGYIDPDEDDINAPDPDDDESHDDFMDRCVEQVTSDGDVDEDTAQDACQTAWENRKAKDIIRKTHSETVRGSEYVLSDDSIDRMGDSIQTNGWDLAEFANEKNPIALFNHNPNFIIGRWQDVRVDGNVLRGRLELANKNTSPRVNEIRKLVEQGILKAVSVGFRDLQSEPLKSADGRALGGLRYLRPQLVEASLVAVPANPNALAIAKSLNISPRLLNQIFAKHGTGGLIRRNGLTGKHARIHDVNGKGAAMSLAQRIMTLEEQLRENKDALQTHLDNLDDTDVTDAEMTQTRQFNSKIEQLDKQRSALIESEKLLGRSADNGSGNGSSRALALAGSTAYTQPGSASLPQPRKKQEKELSALDYLARAAVVAYFQKNTGRLTEEVRQKIPGYDDEVTKEVCNLVLRAPSAPALTTVTGWAAELVHQIYTDFMDLLLPSSILPRLAGYGMALSFGAAGRIIIPTRSRTPSLAGSFVGEGMAIPVRQGLFSSQTLTPKKVAVISTWTREMQDHSIPAIEGLLREAVQMDTSIAIDTVLIDTNAATTIRPAGLLNGLTPLTPTAGGGLTALTGDLKQMGEALVAGTYGNVRKPVWLINPGMLFAASLTSAPNTGIFPFRDEISRGTLNGIPFIDSVTVGMGTLTLIDAADFVVVGGEAPRLELSDQATLHMEDSNPTDLVSTGSPGVVAAPQRSLFQTDSIALRLVMPLNWLQRRAGTIVTLNGATWQ